jgi:hypothetical protein
MRVAHLDLTDPKEVPLFSDLGRVLDLAVSIVYLWRRPPVSTGAKVRSSTWRPPAEEISSYR